MLTIQMVIAANGVKASLGVPVYSRDEFNELVEPMLEAMVGLTREATIEEFEATADEMFGADPSDATYEDSDIVEPTLLSSEQTSADESDDEEAYEDDE